jgi:hypothetical protein
MWLYPDLKDWEWHDTSRGYPWKKICDVTPIQQVDAAKAISQLQKILLLQE